MRVAAHDLERRHRFLKQQQRVSALRVPQVRQSRRCDAVSDATDARRHVEKVITAAVDAGDLRALAENIHARPDENEHVRLRGAKLKRHQTHAILRRGRCRYLKQKLEAGAALD